MKRPQSPPPALPDPADDILDNPIDQQAASERQAAVLGSSGHTWAGKQLHPFSIRRESLYFRLKALHAHVPAAGVMHTTGVVLLDTMLILWLCSHESKDWQHLRGDGTKFMEVIEEWADENIQRHQQTDAVDLAMTILREGYSTQATPRPDNSASEESLGN